MKITAVRLYVLEAPADQRAGALKLIQVPNLRRIQYTHTRATLDQPLRQNFIEVETDEGIRGRCTTTMLPQQIEILRNQVLGEHVEQRERLFQLLQKGTRWLYQPPGWFGDFDNCLWDILGKAAGLPVYALIGKVRNHLPVYLTSGDGTVADYLRHIETGHTMGINTYKFHTYKGGKADMPIFQEVRREVGDDYGLINDPVCSYDLREAIEVGHVMEELGFIWLEEPFHEQKLNLYQELCRELTIPVMANEMLMHDMGLSAQWLIQGGTDRLRANARHGTTQVLKMAHFAELYGANIELNGQGGLAGLVHAHLGCCIDNTDFYEYFSMRADGNRVSGELWGLLNGPLIEAGHIAPPDGPGWGAEWDETQFQSQIVADY
ncbi:MAG TPA: enolase C-terminal domain-like protein [Caldilineaceae bacterium]|nr:enolase C-terminal domain-like protein [Caldilineaceae bacterium]